GLTDPRADRLGTFLRLAQAEPDAAGAVADDDQCAEAEAPATLDDLGHAIDVDDLLLQLGAPIVDDPSRALTHLRHRSIPLRSVRTGGRLRARHRRPRARGRGTGSRCGRTPRG